MESEPYDPRTALEDAADAERRSAQIVASTPWYAPWYGATVALFPVAIAFLVGRSWLGMVLLVAGLVSLTLLLTTFRRVTGLWPSADGMAKYYGVAVAIMVGASLVAYLLGPSWWLLLVGILTAVSMGWLSKRYDDAYVEKHRPR